MTRPDTNTHIDTPRGNTGFTETHPLATITTLLTISLITGLTGWWLAITNTPAPITLQTLLPPELYALLPTHKYPTPHVTLISTSILTIITAYLIGSTHAPYEPANGRIKHAVITASALGTITVFALVYTHGAQLQWAAWNIIGTILVTGHIARFYFNNTD